MSETKSRIALIIVNYNGEDFIQACLDAVAQQTLPPARVIVVDNASTDGSLAIAQTHRLQPELICNENNEGFAVANNQAVALVDDCEWIALLNPDTVAERDWLEQLFRGTSKFPHHAAFASLQVAAGTHPLCDGAGDLYHLIGYGWRQAHNLALQDAPSCDAEVFSACAAATLVKRAVFVELGGFDEDFFCYCEDIDFGFRLRLAGYRTVFIASAQVMHVQSGISGVGSEFSQYHGHRNMIWVFLKNMPAPLLFIMLIPNLVMHSLAIVAAARSGRAGLVARAKWHALQGFPEQLAKRKTIQSSRSASLADLLKVMEKSPLSLLRRLGAR